MKYLKILIFCTAIGVILFTSCNKDKLKNLNINPQALNTIDLNFLFTSAELGVASSGSGGDNRFTDWRTNIGLAAGAIQQLGGPGGITNNGDKYLDNFEVNLFMDYTYPDQLKNIGEILRQSGPGGFAEGQFQNTRQAARILRAFIFERLTDFYGSIPYFEALQAQEQVFFPHYDKQKDIYADLLKEVEEATAAFGTTDGGFAAADLYYNGDITKWKKFGYSLMLRMAMRVSYVDQAMANTYVAKAVAGGVFTSNADNTIVPMATGPSLWTSQNGISRAFIPGDGGEPTFLSQTLINFLKGADTSTVADDDPRLMIISGGIGNWVDEATFVPITTDPLKQRGIPNGKSQAMLDQAAGLPSGTSLDLNKTYSKINVKLLQRDDPYMLMNYGEVELMLAEAAQRSIGGLTPAQAATHYDNGVRASMQMYTIYDPSFVVSDPKVDAYLAIYPYNAATGLRMIGEQYWVNHFMNWYEAWTNWRRTTADPAAPNGYPVLVPVNYPGNVTGGKIFQRLKYPNSEIAGNPNFGSGSTKPNDYVTKVWWAGGPE